MSDTISSSLFSDMMMPGYGLSAEFKIAIFCLNSSQPSFKNSSTFDESASNSFRYDAASKVDSDAFYLKDLVSKEIPVSMNVAILEGMFISF